MSWRLSQALMSLRGEVNEAIPNRSKISDGTVGDLAHAARKSDHNPDENGIVHAWDCTADPVLHVAQQVVDFLTTGAIDPRLKYVIWQRHIFSKRLGRWAWRPYTGANPHDHHAHISVYGDDGAPWGFGAKPTKPAWTPPPFPGVARYGCPTPVAEAWAFLLRAIGYRGFNVSGPFGAGKYHATRRFQKRHGLTIDGIAGRETHAKAVEVLIAKRKAKGLPT